MKKRILSLLLVFVLCVGMLPMQVTAAQDESFTVALDPEIVTFSPAETSAQAISLMTLDETGKVSLTNTNEVNWIDRLDLTGATDPTAFEEYDNNYALGFYYFLVGNSTNGGALLDPESTEYTAVTFTGDATFDYTGDSETDEAAVYAAISDELNDNLNEAAAYLSAVFYAFDRDHPEVFWLSGEVPFRTYTSHTYSSNGTATYTQSVCFVMHDETEEIDIRAAKYLDEALTVDTGLINDTITEAEALTASKIAEFEADLGGSYSRYDMVCKIHDYLTQNNCYNSSADLTGIDHLCYEYVSALAGKTGETGPVCEGYARAFKVLCDATNIPCVLVDGYASSDGASSEAHMWNYVQMDDENWYAVDATWNDPVVSGVTAATSGHENQNYFLVGSGTAINGLTFIASHPVSNAPSSSAPMFTNGPALSENAYTVDENNAGDSSSDTIDYSTLIATGVKLELDSSGLPVLSWTKPDGVEDYSLNYQAFASIDGETWVELTKTNNTSVALYHRLPASDQPYTHFKVATLNSDMEPVVYSAVATGQSITMTDATSTASAVTAVLSGSATSATISVSGLTAPVVIFQAENLDENGYGSISSKNMTNAGDGTAVYDRGWDLSAYVTYTLKEVTGGQNTDGTFYLTRTACKTGNLADIWETTTDDTDYSTLIATGVKLELDSSGLPVLSWTKPDGVEDYSLDYQALASIDGETWVELTQTNNTSVALCRRLPASDQPYTHFKVATLNSDMEPVVYSAVATGQSITMTDATSTASAVTAILSGAATSATISISGLTAPVVIFQAENLDENGNGRTSSKNLINAGDGTAVYDRGWDLSAYVTYTLKEVTGGQNTDGTFYLTRTTCATGNLADIWEAAPDYSALIADDVALVLDSETGLPVLSWSNPDGYEEYSLDYRVYASVDGTNWEQVINTNIIPVPLYRYLPANTQPYTHFKVITLDSNMNPVTGTDSNIATGSVTVSETTQTNDSVKVALSGEPASATVSISSLAEDTSAVLFQAKNLDENGNGYIESRTLTVSAGTASEQNWDLSKYTTYTLMEISCSYDNATGACSVTRTSSTSGKLSDLWPATGYTLTYVYDDDLCDFTAIDYYTKETVENGGILPINTEANRAYGQFTISNIAVGYRIASVSVNDTDRTDSFIDGAYGGCALTITKDSTITVTLEEVPEELPTIASVTIYTDQIANENSVLAETVTFGETLSGLNAVITFADEDTYPSYYAACLWQYSIDGGETWTDLSVWGVRTDFNAAWYGFTDPDWNFNVDFMTLENYLIRVMVTPKEHYSTAGGASCIYSDPVTVNSTTGGETVTSYINESGILIVNSATSVSGTGWNWDGDVLTLDGTVADFPVKAIQFTADVPDATIVLAGDTTLDTTNVFGDYDDTPVIQTLGTCGNLKINANNYTLTVICGSELAYAVHTAGSLSITNGKVKVTSPFTAIRVEQGDLTITEATVVAEGGSADCIEVRGIRDDETDLLTLYGVLTITDATVTATKSESNAIYCDGDMIITNSTVTADGGNNGLGNDCGNIGITDSTVSATGDFIGICTYGTLTFTNSTVTAIGDKDGAEEQYKAYSRAITIGSREESEGKIAQVDDLKLTDCAITVPAGAVITTATFDWAEMLGDSDLASETIVVVADPSATDGGWVTSVTIEPTEPLTRADVCVAIVDAMGWKYNNETVSFPDVSTDHEAYEAIAILASKGIMVGTATGEFDPDGTMPRATLATLLCRILNKAGKVDSAVLPDDVSEGYWAAGYICAVLKDGLMTVDENGKFNPHTIATESDAAFDKLASTVTVTYDMNTTDENLGVDEDLATSVTVVSGSTLTLPVHATDFDRPYYVFKGWFSAAEGGEQVTNETPITGDCTLYAHWEERTTITLILGVTEITGTDPETGEEVGDFVTDATVVMTAPDGTVIPSEAGTGDYEGCLLFRDLVAADAYTLTITRDGYKTYTITTQDDPYDQGSSLAEMGLYSGGVIFSTAGIWEPNATEIASGTVSETNQSWVLTSDGLLTISGGGKLYGYMEADDAPWYKYREQVTKVSLDGVRYIGNYTFADCTNLTAFELPASVVDFRWGVFDGCTNLAAITVAEGNAIYTSVDGVLFTVDMQTLVQYPSGKSDTTYEIPASVTKFGEGAFDGCINLTAITVAEGNEAYTSVDGVLFTADMQTLVQYPAGKSDTTYEIPASVTALEWHAFYRCSNLTAFTVAEENTTFSAQDGVLFELTEWENEDTGETWMAPGDLIQYPIGKANTEYTVPWGVFIRESAFAYASNLTSVTIPYTCYYINSYAFEHCGSTETPIKITFEGDVANLLEAVFNSAYAICYYPDSDSWAEILASEDAQNFGGNVTWTVVYDESQQVSNIRFLLDEGTDCLYWDVPEEAKEDLYYRVNFSTDGGKTWDEQYKTYDNWVELTDLPANTYDTIRIESLVNGTTLAKVTTEDLTLTVEESLDSDAKLLIQNNPEGENDLFQLSGLNPNGTIRFETQYYAEGATEPVGSSYPAIAEANGACTIIDQWIMDNIPEGQYRVVEKSSQLDEAGNLTIIYETTGWKNIQDALPVLVETTTENVTVNEALKETLDDEQQATLSDVASSVVVELAKENVTVEPDEGDDPISDTATVEISDVSLKIEVTEYVAPVKDSDDTLIEYGSLTLNITPVATVSITETNSETGEETTTTSVKEVNTEGTPVVVTIPLPDQFKECHELYVIHTKDDGTKFTHYVDVQGDENTGYFVSFVNTEGFSLYTLTNSAAQLTYTDSDGNEQTTSADTVQTALNCAKDFVSEKCTNVTVTVLIDDLTEDYLYVPANVTLNLNGKKLTASEYVLSFGNVIDVVENPDGTTIDGTGCLVTGGENVFLTKENSQMPLYDVDSDCYRFYTYTLSLLSYKNPDANSVQFRVRLRLASKEAYELLADDANGGLEMSFVITWTGLDSESVTYTLIGETLAKYAEGALEQINSGARTAMTITTTVELTLSGVNALGSGTIMEVKPTVTSETGVMRSRDPLANYTIYTVS